MSTVAEVRLWGRTVGAVALEDNAETTSFQYDPAFSRSGIEIACACRRESVPFLPV